MKGEFCGGSLSCPHVAQWPNKFPDIYIYAHCGYFDAITKSYLDGRHGTWNAPTDLSFGNKLLGFREFVHHTAVSTPTA